MSFVVGERRREIGVRMAVGADGDSLVRMVLVRELVPAVAGVVLGGAGALAARVPPVEVLRAE